MRVWVGVRERDGDGGGVCEVDGDDEKTRFSVFAVLLSPPATSGPEGMSRSKAPNAHPARKATRMVN